MAEARPPSLLGFAIAASLAVLPVLLAVLLGVRSVAPADRRAGVSQHASIRQVAALKTFEHGVVRRDTVQSGPPSVQALHALVPECSGEWGGRDSAADRLKAWAGRADDDRGTPAHGIVAQLAALDEALSAMSAGGNRRVVDPVGFDLARWSQAARVALATAIETPQYPGRRFFVRCADLASAAALLSRGRGRMLNALAWRGTEVQRAVSTWRPDQYVEISARQFTRGNPWDGLPGCIFLLDAPADGSDAAPAYFVKASRSANDRACTQPAVFQSVAGNARVVPTAIAGEPAPDAAGDDLRWQVPPSIHAMLQPLDSLQRTSGALYSAYTEARFDPERPSSTRRGKPNRIVLDGAQVDAGFSVDLTIDPALQSLAQKAAACYTGRQDACRMLSLTRAEDGSNAIGQRLLERAMVRMAAVAIIDVRSGRIEALAGAMSPCTRQEYDGPGRAAGCDARMPYTIRYRPDALRNPAVSIDAMPASVVKPLMAAAFLSNARVGARWLAAERAAMRTSALPTNTSLRGELMRSNSARFLDRMFCADHAFGPCERPWEIQATAREFGWNEDCDAASERCGKRDLLFGRRSGPVDEGAEPAGAWVHYGRLLAEPDGGGRAAFRVRAPIELDARRVSRCAEGADMRRGSDDDWEKCRGGTVVDVVAEGWGQGHARSTALGAAGMMAVLAAAANGQADVRHPHLVRTIRGTSGFASSLESDVSDWSATATRPITLRQDVAEVILSGLSYSHRSGTARRACEQVLDARRCREIDWIAGKTGTPTFPNDDRSLDELAQLCVAGRARTPIEQTACDGLRPYKWYVAAYRKDRADPAWTKAIGVLVERNWYADTGRIHGAGDHGPNPAAELAFQIVSRHAGALAREVQ